VVEGGNVMLSVLVHDVYSAVKLVDAAKVAFNFNVDLFIISKATSSAAQSGVPEIEKIAFKEGKRVLYVPDIPDVLELLNPNIHIMVVPKKLSEKPIDFEELKKALDRGERILISVSAGPTTFSLKELEYGDARYIPGVNEPLPPAATLGIILYCLKCI